MDPTGKCPDCGESTKPFATEVAGRMISFPVRCEKCVQSAEQSALARQNQERITRLHMEWKKFPALYRATDPNHLAIDQDLLRKILEWHPVKAGGKGIGLHGPTGGCKTRMMFLLLRNLHYANVKVRWISAVELSRASSEMFDNDRIIFSRHRDTSTLVAVAYK
jgi:hypothetical protein